MTPEECGRLTSFTLCSKTPPSAASEASIVRATSESWCGCIGQGLFGGTKTAHVVAVHVSKAGFHVLVNAVKVALSVELLHFQ